MQIVIDIDKLDWEVIIKKTDSVEDLPNGKGDLRWRILNAITEGQVLPRKHGRLIDIDKAQYQYGMLVDINGKAIPILHTVLTAEVINQMKTVVESEDKE